MSQTNMMTQDFVTTSSLGTSLGEPSGTETVVSIMNVVFGLGGIVAIVGGLIVPWIVALIQVIRRNDLKESKLLWIILLFVVGPIGVILYAFMENRKKLGYVSIAFYVAIPVILVLFAIIAVIVG